MSASARIATTESAAPHLDKRRITEQDPDYRRLRAQVERVLWAGIHCYAQALRTLPVSEHQKAVSEFIAHQHKALQLGYLAGHWEGERDYWHSVSRRRTAKGHAQLSQAHGVAPNIDRMRRTLMFYGAASITKMAREGQQAWQADQRALTAHLFEGPQSLDAVTLDATANAAMDAWLGGLKARVGQSAEITWTGLQDGYLAAGTVDPANPYAYVWWQLEPAAKHCSDCPYLAASSPYTAPGSGGGNELAQTPGDGSTECGGGCKCTLQYGSSQEPGAASDYTPPLSPLEQWQQWYAKLNIPPAPPAESDQVAAWKEWYAKLNIKPETPPPSSAEANPNGAWQQQLKAWQEWKQQLPLAPQEGGAAEPLGASGAQIVDMTAATSASGATSIIRDFVRVTPGGVPEPLPNLTDGQKQALDDVRGIALLWDAIRGPFPMFEQYFDPASAVNLWQNRDLAGMDSAQQQVVERYFKALGDWADNTPIDE